MFGLSGKKDPVCGMKEEKGNGISKHDKWFCSDQCLQKYEASGKKEAKSQGHRGCC